MRACTCCGIHYERCQAGGPVIRPIGPVHLPNPIARFPILTTDRERAVRWGAVDVVLSSSLSPPLLAAHAHGCSRCCLSPCSREVRLLSPIRQLPPREHRPPSRRPCPVSAAPCINSRSLPNPNPLRVYAEREEAAWGVVASRGDSEIAAGAQRCRHASPPCSRTHGGHRATEQPVQESCASLRSARRSSRCIERGPQSLQWRVSLTDVGARGGESAAFLPLPTGSPWFVATLALAVAVQEALRVGVWFAYRNGSKQLEVLARRMVRPRSPAAPTRPQTAGQPGFSRATHPSGLVHRCRHPLELAIHARARS
jgi:hypothetical protein